MKEANQMRLNPRDRRRQFTDVRQSHSRHKHLSQSQLTRSVGKSRIVREYPNERGTSRISNIENEQSRAMKQSKLSNMNRESKSHNNLMCVCCYNKTQTEYKVNRRNRQKQVEQEQIRQMKQSMIQSHLHKQLLYESHVKQNIQQMTEYNKKLIQRHQQQKIQELNKKRQEEQLMKIQKQNLQMQKQNRIKLILEQQKLLKQKYQEQIKIREQKQNIKRKINQSLDQNIIVDAIIPNKQPERSAAQSLRNAYKQELLKQIQQKEKQKQKQIQQYKGLSPRGPMNQFDLVTFAQKRKQEAKKVATQMKEITINNINQKKNRQKFSKQQKQAQRMEKQRQRRQMIQEQQAQKCRQEQLRRHKIDSYLSDLKSQIEQNKNKRLQELQWINDRKNTQPIIKTREIKQSDKQSCQGCHKRYPKKLLSEFVTVQQ